jgi:phosphate-selective porin OprO and OprP
MLVGETGGETASSAPVISPQVRRLRLRVGGELLSPELLYNLQFSFSRQDMDWDNSAFPNVLRDASLTWKAAPWAHLIFGLAKLPGNRQRLVSSGEMQMIDRSSVNRTFNLDRDFGVQAHCFAEPFSLRLAVSSGEGRGVAFRRV